MFTSGGTESINHAIKGVAHANAQKGKHIITSNIEHNAVLRTLRALKMMDFKVTSVPVDEYGRVDPKDVAEAIRDDTILVTIMHSNNEVGTIQPIKESAEIAREKKVIFHSDAVDSVGVVPIDVQELGVDLLSFAANQFYGPSGAAGVYKLEDLREGPYQIMVAGDDSWDFFEVLETTSTPVSSGSEDHDDETSGTRDNEGNGVVGVTNFMAERIDTEILGVVVNDRDMDFNTLDPNEALSGATVELYNDDDGDGEIDADDDLLITSTTTTINCSASSAPSTRNHLLHIPAKGGSPMMLSEPMRKAIMVTGICRPIPRMSLISVL